MICNNCLKNFKENEYICEYCGEEREIQKPKEIQKSKENVFISDVITPDTIYREITKPKLKIIKPLTQMSIWKAYRCNHCGNHNKKYYKKKVSEDPFSYNYTYKRFFCNRCNLADISEDPKRTKRYWIAYGIASLFPIIVIFYFMGKMIYSF